MKHWRIKYISWLFYSTRWLVDLQIKIRLESIYRAGGELPRAAGVGWLDGEGEDGWHDVLGGVTAPSGLGVVGAGQAGGRGG